MQFAIQVVIVEKKEIMETKNYVQVKFLLGTRRTDELEKELDVIEKLFDESEKTVERYFEDRRSEGYKHFNIQYFPYFFKGEGYVKGYLSIIINAWK